MPRPTLFDHPKFIRLVNILGIPEPHVLGHLEYLWRVGYASGNPVIGDETDVELAAKWAGEKGQFASALVTVRLVDKLKKSGKLQIHDLLENAPDYVRSRSRMERYRRRTVTQRLRNGYTSPTHAHTPTPAPAPTPSPTHKNNPPQPPQGGTEEREGKEIFIPEIIRVAEQAIESGHNRNGAREALVNCLAQGRSVDQLKAAASAYGIWARRNIPEARFRLSIAKFFAVGGDYERFLPGAPPVPDRAAPEARAGPRQQTRAEMIADIERERKAREVADG